MSELPSRVEVAIVGAGTAGAAAALCLARRGLRVVCVDRRPLEEAGARWVNGVPGWAFEVVGLPRPELPELRPTKPRFHFVAGWSGPRLIVDDHELYDVDMRLFLARLQREAEAAGARLLGGCVVQGFDAGELCTDRGKLQARWIIDAAGLAGPKLLRSPALDPRDLCAAAQEVRRCDPAGARAYLGEQGVGEGETLCFSSIAGGYSILNVHVHGDELSLLTGSVPADGNPSGRAMLDDFVASQPWVGERIFGGARAIPIRRSHDRLASSSIAAIGDAACQVFPAHGSGIAPQLLAARCLADALAEGRGLAGYAFDFQRRHGGLLASYDVFRRFSQTLSPADVAALIDAGVMNPSSMRAGLEQRLPPLPDLAELRELTRGLARVPALARRLLAAAGRMAAVQAVYAAYPRSPDALAGWRMAAEACFSRR